MQFSATEDIAAPIEHVWDRVTDADAFEARARERMEGLTRVPSGPAGAGTAWTGRAEVMGRTREVRVTLDRLEPMLAMKLSGGTEGVEVRLSVRLEALGPERTRMTAVTDASARSMAGRMILSSARLARGRLQRGYRLRVAAFAARLEEELGGTA